MAAAFAAFVALASNHATPTLAATRYIDEVFPNVTVTSNIAYGEAINEQSNPETLRLDLYQPTGDTLPSRPVIIFAHGGSFTGGDKAFADPANYSTRMAKRGFVVASINYRLRQSPIPPEEMPQAVFDAKHDMQAAIRWFRANAATYGIDTSRISIAGYSAGAATALFAAFIPEDVGDSGNPGYPSDVAASISISGSMGNAADGAISPGDPPVLLIHGTADATVPYSNATDIVAAADADGVPNELHTLTGAGHSKFGPALMTEITQWSGEFLLNYVIGGSAVGGLTSLASTVRPPSDDSVATVWWLIPAALLLGPLAVCAEWYVRRR